MFFLARQENQEKTKKIKKQETKQKTIIRFSQMDGERERESERERERERIKNITQRIETKNQNQNFCFYIH